MAISLDYREQTINNDDGSLGWCGDCLTDWQRSLSISTVVKAEDRPKHGYHILMRK